MLLQVDVVPRTYAHGVPWTAAAVAAAETGTACKAASSESVR